MTRLRERMRPSVRAAFERQRRNPYEELMGTAPGMVEPSRDRGSARYGAGAIGSMRWRGFPKDLPAPGFDPSAGLLHEPSRDRATLARLQSAMDCAPSSPNAGTTNVRVRSATSLDAAMLARLHAEGWRSAYAGIPHSECVEAPLGAEGPWRRPPLTPAGRPGWKVLLADVGGEMGGVLCVKGDSDRRWGTAIDDLDVDPEHRGRGVGSALMVAAAAWSLTAHPGAGIHVWCPERNGPARRFYECRRGTCVVHEVHAMSDGNARRCLCFHWPDPIALIRATLSHATSQRAGRCAWQ